MSRTNPICKPGDKYGRWTLLGMRASGPRRWLCRCDCGTERVVSQATLRNGDSKSCGCLAREVAAEQARNFKLSHGLAHTPEHMIWGSMIQRCCNPRNKGYSNYGGRGITVCSRWRSSFASFLSDMGLRPSRLHTIERKDNDLGYEPGNAIWATRKEQSRNTRRNRRLTFGGKTLTITDWAKRTGISKGVILARIESGWPVDAALTEKPENRKRGFVAGAAAT